jgi:hypothetical protein
VRNRHHLCADDVIGIWAHGVHGVIGVTLQNETVAVGCHHSVDDNGGVTSRLAVGNNVAGLIRGVGADDHEIAGVERGSHGVPDD